MPLWENKAKDKKILYIHIPKTGGSSVERYLFWNAVDRQDITLYDKETAKKPIKQHHYTYKQIIENNPDNVKQLTLSFATVRNPYERIISALIFNNKLKIKNKKISNDLCMTVAYKIVEWIETDPKSCHNHNIPQYKFILNEDNQIEKSIKIIKTEQLVEGMRSMGFAGFDIYINKGLFSSQSYFELLNRQSIRIINDAYEKDFLWFGYKFL